MWRPAAVLMALTLAYGFGFVPWAFQPDPRDAELEQLRLENELLEVRLERATSSRRMGDLLNHSSDLRHLQKEWERIWFADQPSQLVVDRVHGGITPGQGSLTPGLSEDCPPDLP